MMSQHYFQAFLLVEFKRLSSVFFFFLLLLPAGVQAQAAAGAKISARITAADKSVLDLASAALLRAADSSFVKAAVPDAQGLVEFFNIPLGRYLIRVNLVGYRQQYGAPFAVEENGADVQAPGLALEEDAKALSEVTVSAQKPFIERKLDRLVVNVDNSIVSAGSTLLEVLERSPNLAVNQDNGLQVRGKSGVIVMIDGKPTPLAGTDLINYLRSVPAANIDRIEIITNPSAKYDAAGNAGIIDIKFKKDKREGFNGNFAVSYGQGFYAKPNASTNLNFRNKKWNLFGNYSYSQPRHFTRFYINRKFFNADHSVNSVFDQTSFIKQPITAHNAKFGADYYVNKKTVLGLLFNTNISKSDRDGTTNSIITNPDGSLQYTTLTDNILNSKKFNGFANANLKHDLNGKGMELTVDLDYGKYRADNFQNFVSDYFNALGAPTTSNTLETDQGGAIIVRSVKADYAYPLKKQAKFEAGLKSGFVKTDNDILFFDVVENRKILDTRRSNHFIYDENVNAAYANYSREMKKIDIQAGLRMEHTVTNGRQITTGETFSREYVYLFPSVFVNRKFSEAYQMSLSYSRRIDRPNYRQLNPFRIFVDPYTYVVGDPALKPVLTHSLEWAQTFKGRYITQINYSRSKETITDVFVQDDATKVSNQIPANLQDFDNLSIDVTAPFSIGKWLNSNLNANVYWSKYNSPLQGGRLINEYTSWTARANNSFLLGKTGWSAELNGYYQAKSVWGQFVIRNLGFVSAGIQKVTKDKKSTFKLSVSDIFYTNRIAVIVQYQNMDFFTNRTWDGRVAALSFSHRFGKSTVAQARRRNSGVEEEKKRAN